MSAPLPCPSCCEVEHVKAEPHGYGYFACCANCYDGAPDSHCPYGLGRDADEAVESWNARVEFEQ